MLPCLCRDKTSHPAILKLMVISMAGICTGHWGCNCCLTSAGGRLAVVQLFSQVKRLGCVFNFVFGWRFFLNLRLLANTHKPSTQHTWTIGHLNRNQQRTLASFLFLHIILYRDSFLYRLKKTSPLSPSSIFASRYNMDTWCTLVVESCWLEDSPKHIEPGVAGGIAAHNGHRTIYITEWNEEWRGTLWVQWRGTLSAYHVSSTHNATTRAAMLSQAS